MARNVVCKVVAVLMAIALPASVMSAETQSAMLYASKSAFLNGTSIPRTSAVFPGDKLSVPADSAATITVSGSSILVPALSKITYNGDSVTIEPQAAVAVTTTKGMAAQIQNIRISPAKNGSAQYQVGRYNGQIVVAAKQGTVLIAGVNGSSTLAEGNTTTLPDPEPQNPVPATTGIGSAGSLPTWVAILIGAAAAGITAGVALGTSGTPATPPAP